MPLRELQPQHVWLAAHPHRRPRQISDGSGHRQPRIQPAFQENPIVHVALEALHLEEENPIKAETRGGDKIKESPIKAETRGGEKTETRSRPGGGGGCFVVVLREALHLA